MMVYEESNAVLAWLLEQEHGDCAAAALAAAEVVALDPTLIECDRVMIRAATAQGGNRTPSSEPARLAAAQWMLLTIDDAIVEHTGGRLHSNRCGRWTRFMSPAH